MKKFLKSLAAISLILAVLFSICSCSIEEVMKPEYVESSILEESSQESSENEKTHFYNQNNNNKINEDNNEHANTSSTAYHQKPVSNYKENINKIIHTLEVGKTYSELPLTPEKAGIKNFSCTNNITMPDGTNIIKQYFGDTTNPNNITIRELSNYGITVPVWYIGNKNLIEKAYFQYGDKYHYISSDNPYLELENTDFKILYSFSGYSIINENNSTYTYMGKTFIDIYGEVLFFKSSLSESLYVDPNTAFCVKFTEDKSGISYVNLTNITINPNIQIPDFDKNSVNPDKYSFNTSEDAVNAWINAYKNSDYGTIAELLPTLADNFKLKNMMNVISLPRYNDSMNVKIISTENIYTKPDDEFFLDGMLNNIEEIKKIKISLGTTTADLYLFKESVRGWRVANIFF